MFYSFSNKPKSNEFIALGDSIAWGGGATTHHGYVNHFYEFLQTKHPDIQLQNFAVPGIPSTLFLAQLTLNSNVRAAVKHASIVTISIGGNNLLYCARDHYTYINEACAALGIVTFEYDWPKILTEIRKKIKSQAKLFVITLYNPYKGDDPNFQKADSYIQQLNTIILNAAYIKKYNYTVVDVYSNFKGKINKQWKTCTLTHFCQSPRDPHPTDMGHFEIYQLHKEKYV